MMSKNVNSIDICKFIMSICVVAIHIHPLANCNNDLLLSVYNNIVSLAVPFFFTSTGYFLFHRMGDNLSGKEALNILKMRILQLFKVYIFWSVIYFPIALFYYFHDNQGFLFDLCDYIRKFLFTSSNHFSTQFWYLLRLIYSLLLIYFLLRKKITVKVILAIGFVFYILGMFINYKIKMNDMTGIFGNILKYFVSIFSQAKLLKSFLFVCLGGFISRIEFKKYINKTIFFFGLFGFWGICIGPKLLINEFILPLEVIILFTFLLNFNIKNRKVYIILRSFSKIIFYTHMYFYFIYTLVSEKFTRLPPDGSMAFGIVLFLCMCVASLLLYLDKCTKNTKVNKLIVLFIK